MNKSSLVRIFGFRATLIHGDTLVLDRWRWLKSRIPKTANGEMLIDVGCGTGAFSIGAALRGYKTLGLSWDKRNQNTATERALICKAGSASFEIADVRNLNTRGDLVGKFDVAVCFENIEHIINDQQLIRDIAACLKPGGRLLLTTPYLLYRPIDHHDMGPFSKIEDGGHVRRGYTVPMLNELCKYGGLIPDRISFCSGFFSQKVTKILRTLSNVNPLFGWIITLPLRLLPLIFDRFTTALTSWPSFSICLEAYKPQHGTIDKDSIAGSDD